MDLKKFIRDVPNFPKEGIMFKDITPLLQNPDAFNQAIIEMYQAVKGMDIDYVVSMEARGFIFGAPLALKLGAGFIPVRKPGKLPYRVKEAECIKESESGKAILVAAPVFDAPEWIPHSQITDDSEIWKPGQTGELIITEWLAEKKGWL